MRRRIEISNLKSYKNTNPIDLKTFSLKEYQNLLENYNFNKKESGQQIDSLSLPFKYRDIQKLLLDDKITPKLMGFLINYLKIYNKYFLANTDEISVGMFKLSDKSIKLYEQKKKLKLSAKFQKDIKRISIYMMNVEKRWTLGCYDSEKKDGYINDIQSKKMKKIEGFNKIFEEFLNHYLEQNVEGSKIQYEANYFENLKGDHGIQLLYVYFQQFISNDVKFEYFKEKIIFILMKIIKNEQQQPLIEEKNEIFQISENNSQIKENDDKFLPPTVKSRKLYSLAGFQSPKYNELDSSFVSDEGISELSGFLNK